MKNKLIFLTIIIFLSCNLTAHAGESIDTNIDRELKAIWGQMINRLAARDIAGELEYSQYIRFRNDIFGIWKIEKF